MAEKKKIVRLADVGELENILKKDLPADAGREGYLLLKVLYIPTV